MKLIGLIGAKGCGKSTAASWLAEKHNYEQASMADPLKNMLRCLGLNDRQLYGDLKELPTSCYADSRNRVGQRHDQW